MFMVLSVLNDEAYNILRKPPPIGALPDIVCLPELEIYKAEWELEFSWRKILDEIPEHKRVMPCSIHSTKDQCEEDHLLDKVKYIFNFVLIYFCIFDKTISLLDFR